MTSNTLSLPKALALVAASVMLGVALAEVYALAARHAGEAWLGAAIVHTALALVLLLVWGRRGRLRAHADGPGLLAFGRPWMYAPAVGVLAATALLALLTSSSALPTTSSVGTRWAWILWVPIVEELVFRVGLGSAFRARAGNVWGAWFSAIVFALAHAAPTIANLMGGRVGLPLGPFLLALCCEALFVKTGRILPAIALHAACNATVVIFATIDGRWLTWLGFLYQ